MQPSAWLSDCYSSNSQHIMFMWVQVGPHGLQTLSSFMEIQPLGGVSMPSHKFVKPFWRSSAHPKTPANVVPTWSKEKQKLSILAYSRTVKDSRIFYFAWYRWPSTGPNRHCSTQAVSCLRRAADIPSLKRVARSSCRAVHETGHFAFCTFVFFK